MVSKLGARWITRLLANWNEDTPWVKLAKWSITQINAKWGHGASALITPSTSTSTSSSPSPFWAAATSAFWKLDPHYQLDKPECQFLARTIPLFNNRDICDQRGKSLKEERWKRLTDVGIRRLCDLVFFDHIGTDEEIKSFYGKLPQKALDILRAAIPQHR